MSDRRACDSAPPGGCFRPAQVCRALLAALEAAEGRRRARKRDQTPDAIGLGVKRTLLEHIVLDDPEPDAFEAWLLGYLRAREQEPDCGSAWAMAQAVLDEWRLAHAMPQFAAWLSDGAPSADASEDCGHIRTPRSVA